MMQAHKARQNELPASCL